VFDRLLKCRMLRAVKHACLQVGWRTTHAAVPLPNLSKLSTSPDLSLYPTGLYILLHLRFQVTALASTFSSTCPVGLALGCFCLTCLCLSVSRGLVARTNILRGLNFPLASGTRSPEPPVACSIIQVQLACAAALLLSFIILSSRIRDC